jgi:hypothetical protein
MPHSEAFRQKVSSVVPTAGRGESRRDLAQISPGLMMAENGFFGAVRQDNPAAPTFV